MIRYLTVLITILFLSIVVTNTDARAECSPNNPVGCVSIVYDELEDNQPVSFQDIVLITYYGELGILDHTEHREIVIEAFVRYVWDSQSGLMRCYSPLIYPEYASQESCIFDFLATSQHWRDSVTWRDGDWYVNTRKLTGNGKYFEYADVLLYVANPPQDSWTKGQSYSRPSIWGNTVGIKKSELPKDVQSEIFLWVTYDYNGCEYSFFIATAEVRNVPLGLCGD